MIHSLMEQLLFNFTAIRLMLTALSLVTLAACSAPATPAPSSSSSPSSNPSAQASPAATGSPTKAQFLSAMTCLKQKGSINTDNLDEIRAMSESQWNFTYGATPSIREYYAKGLEEGCAAN